MTPTGPAPTAAAHPAPAVDVVTLGESMVTFLPSRPGRLADVPSFDRAIGGAESNVACVLAAAGHTARWVSRVGADGFGDHLTEAIGAYGVDTSAVQRDPTRPTGIYFRTASDRSTDAHEVAYYRTGSAASAMAPDTVDLGRAPRGPRAAPLRHHGGALRRLSAPAARADGAAAPTPARLLRRQPPPRTVATPPEGPRVLLDLARGADIVFVGDDEAGAAWGMRGAAAAPGGVARAGVLVVKQGRRRGDGLREGCGTGPTSARTIVDVVTFVPRPARRRRRGRRARATPSPPASSPRPCADCPSADRLRHGHLMAAAALTDPGDLGAPPSRDHADRLAALDDDAWGTLRLGPGWTHTADRAQEEVPTP